MKTAASFCFALIMCCNCHAQTSVKTVSLSELESINGLPLDKAVAARQVFKKPLQAAYARQIEQAGKDCQPDSGQQPYNVCIGKASVVADSDFAVFYNNLQMLCHDQEQLVTLQDSEKRWAAYRDSAMNAAHAACLNGTGASSFASQVYLSLIRGHMRELDEIYGLDISQ